ncbi:MAG: hypothetical protein ACI4FZ_03030 [Lachnospiraceae bacterium]
MAEESEKDILQCGELELQKLKDRLLQSEQQEKVLKALELRVRKQEEKIELRRKEIESEIEEEEKAQRAVVARPYFEEIADKEAQIQSVKEERASKREEEIIRRTKEEKAKYEERKLESEQQIKEIIKEENIPDICVSKLFLACFFPKSVLDVLILLVGIVLIFCVLPCVIYFVVLGGGGGAVLTGIYLVITLIFYTAYLVINNLVKEKYMVGLKKINAIRTEMLKLELNLKMKLQNIEKLPNSALNLKEFEDKITFLEQEIEGIRQEQNVALQNFDSDENLKKEIADTVWNSYRQEMDMLTSSLSEQEAAYQEQKQEVELFKQSIISDKRYEPLVNLEPNIFRISVVDDLLFYIKTGAAEDIAEAMIKHKTK